MAEADNAGSQGQEHHEAPGAPRWIPIAFLMVVVALSLVAYMGHGARRTLETELAKANQRSDLLSAQLEQANNRIAELKAQFEITSEKLGMTAEELSRARSMAQNILKDQKASDEQLKAQLGQLKQESEAQIGAVAGEVKGAKSDIEATKRDLEAAKGRLERTIGDANVMSGLIARNREELEELKRRGERNVFEFDLRKTKDFQRVGPVQVKLNKVDVKKNRYTMLLYADDKSIEKKDKTLNEPVQFYVRGVRVPYEIVVYELAKDRAIGYLTTPKEVAAQRMP
jgi:chromosome segregation ATPase